MNKELTLAGEDCLKYPKLVGNYLEIIANFVARELKFSMQEFTDQLISVELRREKEEQSLR